MQVDQVINRVKAFVVEHFAGVDTNDLLDARYSATGVENVLKEVFGEGYASCSLVRILNVALFTSLLFSLFGCLKQQPLLPEVHIAVEHSICIQSFCSGCSLLFRSKLPELMISVCSQTLKLNGSEFLALQDLTVNGAPTAHIPGSAQL